MQMHSIPDVLWKHRWICAVTHSVCAHRGPPADHWALVSGLPAYVAENGFVSFLPCFRESVVLSWDSPFAPSRSATWWTLRQTNTSPFRWDSPHSLCFYHPPEPNWCNLDLVHDRKKRWMRLDGRSRTSSPFPLSIKRKKLLESPLSSTEKTASPSMRMMNRSQKYGKILFPVHPVHISKATPPHQRHCLSFR